MRRLGLASLNRGAKSPVRGTAPSVAVGRRGRAVGRLRTGARHAAPRRLPGPRPVLHLARHAATYGMSVVYLQCGRWYVKDIRASTQPRGTHMTWYASPWAAPRGSRSPRKLTDVHGREG